MAKTLPVLGIVGAVMAALAVLVLVSIAGILAPLFAIVAAVFLLRERNAMATALAVLAILLALLAIAGLLQNVSYKDSGIDLGIALSVGVAFSMISCLVIAVAVPMLRANDVVPEWLSYVGYGCAALAAILAFTNLNHLSDQSNGMALLTGLLCLGAMAPSIPAMRNAA